MKSRQGSGGHGEEASRLESGTLMSAGGGLAAGAADPLLRLGGRGGCSARKSISPDSAPTGS